jgi:hypothetical protein
MLIHINLNTSSYLPEAYAYRDYLVSNNYDVILSESIKSYKPDLIIKFLGFTLNSHSDKKFSIIHEYSSSSVPPFPHFKNYIKKTFNGKPNGRIFLNSFVKNSFGFNDNVPFIYRDMGIDTSFFEIDEKCSLKYDVIYCGFEHIGLKSALLKLVNFKLKIVLVGNFSTDLHNTFKSNIYVTFLGRLNRNDLASIYKSCRYGLNYTPDIFPFNSQTSTKTLEYCAAGLGIISNKYSWIENFMKDRNCNFLWLDNILSRDYIENFEFTTPNLEDLKWDLILKKADFIKFIDQCIFDK